MAKIQLIIFDLDGTLVDAYAAVVSSLNYSLKSVGCPAIDDDTIKRSVGWGDRNLLARFVSQEVLEQALATYRKHHKEALIAGTKFLPNAQEVLRTLKEEKYLLAIASNRPKPFTNIILKYLTVLDCFDVVLCADEVAHPKPAADILLEVLSRLQISRDQTLYVGDMPIDVQAAKAADIRAVTVATGSCTQKELLEAEPFKMLEQVGELLNFLSEIQ